MLIKEEDTSTHQPIIEGSLQNEAAGAPEVEQSIDDNLFQIKPEIKVREIFVIIPSIVKRDTGLTLIYYYPILSIQVKLFLIG